MLLRRSRSDHSLFGSPESLKSTLSRDSVSRNKLMMVQSNVGKEGKHKDSRLLVGKLHVFGSRLTPRKSLTPCRRVKFTKDQPDVIPTLNRFDLTEEEYQKYWIQPEEMKRTIDRNWNIIDAYEKSKKNNESTFQLCTRGLESYIIELQRGKKSYAIKRKNAYTAVLLWGRGLSDEETARRYQLVSKRSVKRAVEYARRDAVTAKRILKEDDSSVRSDSDHSQRSFSSLSTRSSLDIPCIFKRRDDCARIPMKLKKSNRRKSTSETLLRPSLKLPSGTIPQIVPEIYVRSTQAVTKINNMRTKSSRSNKVRSRHASVLREPKVTTPYMAKKRSLMASPHKDHERVQPQMMTACRPRLPLPPVLDEEDTNDNPTIVSGTSCCNQSPNHMLLQREFDEQSYHQFVSQLTQGKLPMSPSAKALTSAKEIFSKLKI